MEILNTALQATVTLLGICICMSLSVILIGFSVNMVREFLKERKEES
jgi:hypothetical protein